MSDWYKRSPVDFLQGVQGMGPEAIGAYAVILEIIYARDGDMPRDDRHLAGVLGCSIRKARALTDQLIEYGKIKIEGERVVNGRATEVLKDRKKRLETNAKPTRNQRENQVVPNENNNLGKQIRIDKNNTPLTPLKGGRRIGVPDEVKKKLGVA